MPTLPVTLDRSVPGSLPGQLSGGIRALVVDGTLTRGDRLPSSRALAADLGVSRSVTEQAYEQLLAEGWLEARRGAGTFVAATGAGTGALPRRRPVRAEPELVRLDAGTPWIDPRHAAGWRRAWREVSTARPPRGYDDPRGLPELRGLLAERLARTRGLAVDPEEVVVTSGTTDGLRHLLTVLPPGPVALEDPGYRAAAETVRGVGREVRDLPADGPITDLADAAAAYVTPAHQHPLGRVMPGSDRLTLLAAARAAGAVVVEDDYDSEFRYDVAPVPALASLDRTRVAYLGTAAKSVAPSLRLGWLLAPPDLLDPLNARRVVTHEGAPWPVQRAYLALLRDGYVDKVVRTARRVYAERAPRVAAALSPYAELAGPLAGMYSTWLLPQGDALRARTAARRAGFEVNLLSDYCRTAALTGLVVGFGGVTDDELDRALAALTSALG
ncbi:aminotransferase class I/II-fold pyridoxal phosphate-dependent enzyme [Nocardioides sp. MAH-18]|uniref:Aminotransferase class I/II-fold pyridoxal phosphate-dependent enzyme n=1 Tax=Nocardioides agri TaxID=2682843 RepID=A0A6L6XQD2_9ACTN|nr:MULTISPECIES: PLP-dependent aminotransferase family protein [unclassified Nocardioides]MBA2956682.1 PLP-dependent aminotransferase family protein [Nocardioides sp. CGMCC 1.13656]MVQ47825.1 aminotransferase class I/II-fold pyridoxal phosphate-dependent enzyme [Nocardioides sp. MAH-18]